MKQTDWDVIIVGAGPTGGRTATHLASLGHNVLMLEEHTETVSYTHLTLPTKA